MECGTSRPTILLLPARSLLALLVALAHPPASGFTGPLPETARSGSVLTPSVFLEDPVNLYLFPQLAPSRSSALMAFGATGESAPGAGAHVSLDEHSLHYLFQSRSPYRLYELEDRPVFQAGWGIRLGEVRLGLSYAWAAAGLKEKRSHRELYSDGAQKLTREDASFQTADYRHATLGVGWQRGRTSGDLAIGLMQENVESERSLTDERVHYLDLRRYVADLRLRANSGYHPVLALRLAVPLGDDTLVRGYGFFRDGGFDTSLDRHALEWCNEFLLEDEKNKYHDEDTGQEWSCGIAVEGQAKWAIRWMVHGLWENERSPSFYAPFRSSAWRFERERWKVKRGQCGVALRIPFRWRLEILSGAAVRAAWVTEISEEFREGSLAEFQIEDEESTSYAFAWGLARDFGVLELTASVRKTLRPDDPFALLDARIRF